MNTDSIFLPSELLVEVKNGYIRMNKHDDSDIWILNYTEKAAYEGHWNNVTLNCRGLIVDSARNIIARPFPKFFNYGQPGCPEIDLDELVSVTDKLDGSLGILYYNSQTRKHAIATRGSFTSDQAIHATEVFNTKYAGYIPPGGVTMLFEIIYPENRIVCNYDGMDDLVLLGSVHNESGDNWDGFAVDWDWPGPIAEDFPYTTMREALAAKPRPGKEGFVVNFLVTGNRVKIKQEDYISLHRIVTGLNARSVWEAMLTDSVDELIEQIPDEFHEFIREVELAINKDVTESMQNVYDTYNRILLWLNNNDLLATKKNFALKVQEENDPMAWALFKIWDGTTGQDIHQEFLKRAKPKHDFSPVKVSNDAN